MEYTSFLQQALEDFASAEGAKVPIITSILFVKCVLHPILYRPYIQGTGCCSGYIRCAHMVFWFFRRLKSGSWLIWGLGIVRCNLFSRQQTLTVKNQFILDSVCHINLLFLLLIIN